MFELLHEKITSSEIVLHGKIFDIMHADVILSDGKGGKREAMIHNGGVCILAVTDEGTVPVVCQYRFGADRILLELPAGKLEKNEDPFDCAMRELREETGFCAELWTSLGYFFPTPAISTEKIYIYLARELKNGASCLDDGELLSSSEIPFNELVEMAEKGEIIDAKTVVAIMRAKHFLKK